MFKQIKKNWYLYVLLCEDNKYYIGTALDLIKRIDTEFKQLSRAAIFCKKHKPKDKIDEKDLGLLTRPEAELKENIETCNYIDKYGFDNVSGGGFTALWEEKSRRRQYRETRTREANLFAKRIYKKRNEIFVELECGKKYKLDTVDIYDYPLTECFFVHINKKTYRLGKQITKDDCSGFNDDESATKALSVISQFKK